MKIHSVGGKLFLAEGQIERQAARQRDRHKVTGTNMDIIIIIITIIISK
jgi:hypothetical protein